VIEWKFNANMNRQGEYHDMFVDGEYASCWIQRHTASGSQWRFAVALSENGLKEYHSRIRDTFAEAQNDGIAWWAAQQLARMRDD
jgi:hypothetical protein